MINQSNNENLQPGFEKLFTDHDLSEKKIYEKLLRLENFTAETKILKKIIKSYETLLKGKRSQFFNSMNMIN